MGASGAIYALYLKLLTKRNLVVTVSLTECQLLVKKRISVSESPFFGGLRGNVCDSSLARWKADSRLSIGYELMTKYFSLALTTKALLS